MDRLDKVYFYTNTKMCMDMQTCLQYVETLSGLVKTLPTEKIELSVMPPYTALYPCGQLLKDSSVILGAQNVFWEEQGQFTGEISAGMLQELGVGLVMLGHSERRRLFGETDEQINRKVHAALAHDLIVLLSISDQTEDWKNHLSEVTLIRQLKNALQGVERSQTDSLRILYEPAWAIGEGGKAADPAYINQCHYAVHMALVELFGEKGKKIPIIYGGSVSADNAMDIYSMEYVDGLGIGRNAWNAHRFYSIMNMILEGDKNAENIK